MVQSGPVLEGPHLAHLSGTENMWSGDLQTELEWYEAAELDNNSALRYVLGHHFPNLLTAFIHRSYFYAHRKGLAEAYFHAVVDALIPADGEAFSEERHGYEDDAFASELTRASPQLMLFVYSHPAPLTFIPDKRGAPSWARAGPAARSK